MGEKRGNQPKTIEAQLDYHQQLIDRIWFLQKKEEIEGLNSEEENQLQKFEKKLEILTGTNLLKLNTEQQRIRDKLCKEAQELEKRGRASIKKLPPELREKINFQDFIAEFVHREQNPDYTQTEIIERLKFLLDDKGLKPLMPIENSFRPGREFATLEVENSQGKRYILKIVAWGGDNRCQTYRNEWAFYKEFKPILEAEAGKMRVCRIPSLVDNQIMYHRLPYLLREKVEGNTTSEFMKQSPNIKEEHIEPLINTIKILQQTSTEQIPSAQLAERRDFENLVGAFQLYSEEIKDYLTKEGRVKMVKMLLNDEKLLKRTPKVITHGDIQPANMALNSEPVLFDWERVHLAHAGFDYSFMYALSWNNPEWKKKYLSQVLEKNQDIKDFPELLRLGLIQRLSSLASAWLERGKKENSAEAQTAISKLIKDLKIIIENDEDWDKKFLA